ncbi:aminotransferase class IV family protein [Tranquillimonas rosea]|uniref:aminotransferase class IV family protein n=1 Tax=Tranquillimonas rosea TaxID=641238 RepID=UPI000B864682|nr:aminotransferase class IV family protein [Tranquillimonas rosea]
MGQRRGRGVPGSSLEERLRAECPADLSVIETLRFEPADGIALLPHHLERLTRTCRLLEIPLDPDAAHAALRAERHDTARRLRLTVTTAGDVAVTAHPLPPTKDVWHLALSDTPVRSDDPWLRVKTSRRALYDAARAALPDGIDEMIFLNERQEVAEGAITSVFVERAGALITPPLESGCLPGVLRAQLLQSGRAREVVLAAEDLRNADRLFVGNALRGLVPAMLTG